MGAEHATWEWPDDQFVEYAQARQHALLRAAYLVCGDLRLAEDLVTEALVSLARQWQHVREEQPELVVRRTLYREAIASWRHRAPERLSTAPAREEPDQPWDAAELERRRDVLAALDTLSPRQRAVVVLLWFEERPEHEVARVLGCSTSALRTEADAAVARMRDALPAVDLHTGGAR